MDSEVLMSQEGYDKLEKERDELISVRRKEVSESLKEARSYGDLSENAEYDAAKAAYAELEDRIMKIEELMRNAKIISDSDISSDKVNVGVLVEVKDRETGKKSSYKIVGKTETDPFSKPAKISNDSAIGKALIGQKVGSSVEVPLPNKMLHLEIVKITK
jgi:transcription elongation factor GreA